MIEFDGRFIDIQFNKNTFDIWVKLKSIGNKIIIKLPSKKHKHFNKYFGNWDLRKSCRLRKVKNKFYIDLFFKKEKPKIKQRSAKLGIDLGINVLISTSKENQYGKNFKKLLQKLDRKKQKSKKWFKVIQEIKNYIGEQVNKIDFKKYNLIVLENLKNINKNTKKEKKVNKKVRKYLNYWNFNLIRNRIKNRCEEQGLFLAFVDPKYTSQICFMCKNLDKSNRHGEYFKCTICGYENNADINAAMNILNRFELGFCST